MQTEGLSQHVCCQHCDSKEKPIIVVTPGKMEQQRQLVCFCTYCWRFTSKHHSKDANMDMTFFKQIPSRASPTEEGRSGPVRPRAGSIPQRQPSTSKGRRTGQDHQRAVSVAHWGRAGSCPRMGRSSFAGCAKCGVHLNRRSPELLHTAPP
jgi:hypothetical protein